MSAKEIASVEWQDVPGSRTPRSGQGTCVFQWAFARDLPLTSAILDANDGKVEVQAEGWTWLLTFGFGGDKRYVHRKRFLR